MTFGYHYKDETTAHHKWSSPNPGGLRLIKAKPSAKFKPPKTGSESGFIREIPIGKLRAGKA